jgi:hypothetical protein
LQRILLSQDPLIPVRRKTDLIEALGLAELTTLERPWSDPSQVYPKVLQVASLKDRFYFENVVAGIVTSIGALTDDVSKHASASLLQWAKHGESEQREQLGRCLLTLLEEHSRNGRVVLPVLKTLNLVFSHRHLDKVVQSEGGLAGHLLQALQHEAVSKDVSCLFAIVDVTVALLIAAPVDKDVERRALAFLCTMLTHKFPRVRSYSAEQFYLCLLESDSDEREPTLNLVLNTTWASESFTSQRKVAVEIAKSLNVLDEFSRGDSIVLS